MNKRNRDTIAGVVSLIFLAGSWYLLFYIIPDTNVYIKISVLIFGTAAINGFTQRLLPKKKTTKKSTSKKPTNSKQSVKTATKNGTSITSSNRLLPDDEILKLPLDKMSWKEFERLCFMYYKAKGYKPELTKDGADGGVDLIYFNRYHNTNIAVQIKHRVNSGRQVTVEEIRSLGTAKRNHKCILAEFITSSTFTNDALKEAGDFKIETHDIVWVKNKIVKWQREETKKKQLVGSK